MSGFAPEPAHPRLPAALRFALRELRGAGRGFGVFLACLALGVMAVAGIGSFARALTDGLQREGRVILGGDASFDLVQREATADEVAFLAGKGEVSRVAFLRVMARAASGEATLVEMKAVDGAYPLAGAVELAPPLPLAQAFARQGDAFGAVADEMLLSRLKVQVGDTIRVGDARVVIRATLASEPDKLSSGVGFGARLLVPLDALPATGLIQPGSLVRWSYRLTLPDTAPEHLSAVMDEAHARFADAGFRMRTRERATPQLEDNVGRISQFLTLVALTALLVGGVGVANAVSSHLAAKTEVIATLKAVGAPRRILFATYGIEIALIAALGIAIGLAAGAAVPFLGTWALKSLIPFPLAPRLDGASLGLAAAYGALVAFAFSVWPLAVAQRTPVSTLFRDRFGAARAARPWGALLLMAMAGLVLAGVALATAADMRAAAIFLGAALAVLALLRLVALGLTALARRLPRPQAMAPRLALANVHRPGALTATVMVSLGLGLSLMVAVALVDRSLTAELNGPLSEDAPSFFFVDVPSAEDAAFSAFLKEVAPEGRLRSVPMLRGRITALNGVEVEKVTPDPDAAWVLRSDRGISTAATLPEGSTVVAGQWWAPDTPEPLVSFDAKLARGLRLKLGDTVTVNVLGRPVTAKIANLREVNWERLGINFVMLFSPSSFAGAPYTVLSTLTFPNGADTAREMAVLRAVAERYPAVTTVRVKESLEQARKMLAQLSLGIRVASVLTLITSALVMAGALAAGHQQRVYDAVILKTLGATRGRLLAAYGLEYAGIGLVTALVAIAAGSAAAYGVVVHVMEIGFAFSLPVAAGAVAGGLAFTVVVGLLGTLRALDERPARVLRHL